MHQLTTSVAPGPGRLRRLARGLARAWKREVVGTLGPPLLLAGMLAGLHLAGAFSPIDLRVFDALTTSEPGTSPQVVVIERDAAFEVGGAPAIARLEAELAARGAERIGHLGSRPAALAAPPVPVVVGVYPERLATSNAWRLPVAPAGTLAGARISALPDYGINRRQLGQLPGQARPVLVFDTALAGGRVPARPFLVRMPIRQSIPTISASQLLAGELAARELQGTVALVASAPALRPALATPLAPHARAMNEASFRAHVVQNLRSGREVYAAPAWLAWMLLLVMGAVLALAYRRIDPKRLALGLPLVLSALALLGGWAALTFSGQLLPIAALTIAPWPITFQQVLARELRQDRRLEESAARAIDHAFRRSALREGARLPEFLGFASQIAGVERSLLVERQDDGTLTTLQARNADPADIALERRKLARLLGELRGSAVSRDAGAIVPSWPGSPRIAWLNGAGSDHYWIYSEPVSQAPARSARLVRAIASSFRQLFHWRTELNARSRQDERFAAVDDRVGSAIALLANESEQIRKGFDTIDTAVMIFHLIGSPLHANARMEAIYREAGLSVADTGLPAALAALTELDGPRIEAMLRHLVLHGGEMRIPMLRFGPEERVIRLAAPHRMAREAERVLVLEALDVAHLNHAADLRQAVAQFIDLQLRNDLEAILLGTELAGDTRLGPAQLRPVIARIGETARRGAARLDSVAELVRATNNELVDASYPVDPRQVVIEAQARALALADELGVAVEADLPGVSGFAIAEPRALTAMLVAMLRVVIADTPQGETVRLRLEEGETRTHIRVSGGFGIGFGRLMWLLTNYENEAVGEYRVIGEGMAKAVSWDASVSYWGREAEGFGFNIDLRRID